MSTSAVDVVRAYFATWPAKDGTAVEALVADDFTFTSPLDNRLNRTTFFARCWPNSNTIAALEITRLVPDGELVFVTYELTSADGHRLRNTEAVSVRGNQVCAVEVYFGWDLPHRATPGGFIDKL
jgi:ketosteroid isomerase-like protein